MKKLIQTIILFTGAAAMAAESGLFVGGTKVDTIYYAEKSREAETAAKDLQSYLERVVGEKFILKKSVESADNGIFVGGALVPDKEKKTLELPSNELEWTGRIARKGQLYLFGNDENKYPGTVWAVTGFLEQFCGVRWLWPGELGEVVPEKKRIEVPEGTVIDRPAFRVRCWSWVSFGYGSYYGAQERKDLNDWTRRRQRFGSSLPGAAGGMGFGHAFSDYITPAKDGKDHPEYFSLVSPANWVGAVKPSAPARTNDSVHWQLCTGNPEVRKIVADKIIARGTSEINSISPNDGYMFCECELCRKADPVRWESIHDYPNLSNRIFEFAADVCAQVKKKNPDGKVGIFSYSFFSDAPTNVEKLPDNLYISMTYLCNTFRNPEIKKKFEERIKSFSRLGAKFVGREYWGTHYYCNMPWLHTKLIAENLKFIQSHGAMGIYGECGKDWSNNALNYYVLARMMWNPGLKLEDVVDDFCRNAFGGGAEAMKAYFEYVENHIDRYYSGREFGNGYAAGLNDFVAMFDKEFVRKGNQMLNTALRAAGTPEQKARVEFFRTGLNYSLVFTDALRAYRKAAGIGLNLVFIQPDSSIRCIDDAMIEKILTEAERAGMQREYYLSAVHGTNALDFGLMQYIGRTVNMSWERVVQDQKLAWRQGYYNYLGNGAFEYNGSWDYRTVKGQAAARIDLSTCHDSITNNMAQYHGQQGRSLKIELGPDSELAAESAVRVKSEPGVKWKLDGFLLSGSPEVRLDAVIEWNDGGRKQFLTLERRKDEVVRERTGWEEIRFRPFVLPSDKAVEMRVILKASNSGKASFINIDDFKLMKTQ